MGINPSNSISEQMTGVVPFPNVAGHGIRDPEGVDKILASELEAAGIPVVRISEADRAYKGGEPRSVVQGKLGNWTFKRAWYYWVAKAAGRGLPLNVANVLHELYGQSVRVAGHCGCPAPSDNDGHWLTWISDTNGKTLLLTKEQKGFDEMIEAGMLRHDKVYDEFAFVDDREAHGKPYVMNYDVDNPAGLEALAAAIRLAKPVTSG